MIAAPKTRPFALGESASSVSASGFTYNMTLFFFEGFCGRRATGQA